MSWDTMTSVFCSRALELGQHRDDAALDHDVQRGRRLVGQDYLRMEERRQRHDHPLAHPAAQLVRVRAEHVDREVQLPR